MSTPCISPCIQPKMILTDHVVKLHQNILKLFILIYKKFARTQDYNSRSTLPQLITLVTSRWNQTLWDQTIETKHNGLQGLELCSHSSQHLRAKIGQSLLRPDFSPLLETIHRTRNYDNPRSQSFIKRSNSWYSTLGFLYLNQKN